MGSKSLVRNFSDVFCCTRRQGNSATHNIAKQVSEFSMWMEDVPPHLFFIILTNAAIS